MQQVRRFWHDSKSSCKSKDKKRQKDLDFARTVAVVAKFLSVGELNPGLERCRRMTSSHTNHYTNRDYWLMWCYVLDSITLSGGEAHLKSALTELTYPTSDFGRTKAQCSSCPKLGAAYARRKYMQLRAYYALTRITCRDDKSAFSIKSCMHMWIAMKAPPPRLSEPH
jgi:hypothetical protein